MSVSQLALSQVTHLISAPPFKKAQQIKIASKHFFSSHMAAYECTNKTVIYL